MDILYKMTKEEIIRWAKESGALMFRSPQMSDVLFWRWEKKDKELSKRRRANIEYGESLNMSKRDEYARQFNASTDIQEKISLAEKMEPYDKKFQKYIKDGQALIEEEKKLDVLYAKIDIARGKETKQRLKAI